MTFGELATRATIRLSLALYVAVLAGNLWFGPLRRLPPGHRWRAASRMLWTLACAALLVHIGAAFHYYHHWSHAAALADTARRTADALGVAFGGGIYWNYLLAAVWVADCGWWWISPGTYERRPRWLTVVVHGYLLFIAVNGAMVFAAGVIRGAGVVACVALAALAARRYLLPAQSRNAA